MLSSAPSSREDFEIALICALSTEASYVELIFDKFWEDDGIEFGKVRGDANAYTTGVVAGHNVVLAHMPSTGKVSAANVASTLKISFPRIQLAIVVGICGGVPRHADMDEEIILGDVIVSQALVQYDFGRQYHQVFARKDTIEDSLGRPSPEIRSLLAKLQTLRSRRILQDEMITNLDALQSQDVFAKHPGMKFDKLYDSEYVHKHQSSSHGSTCNVCNDEQVCADSRVMNCSKLGCDEARLVVRQRLTDAGQPNYGLKPIVHFGKMGSGDSVMKSGLHRDRMADEDGIIAFEMEGAGLWEHFPSIVVKGVCDYADSHKNKAFQRYAAATAACCVKAMLKRWTSESKEIANTPTTKEIRPELVWHVPFEHIQGFFGRERESNDLRSKLFQSPVGQRAAVFGLGGVGKSRISWEMASYARSLGHYSVFWIQSNSVSSLEKDYLEIGMKLQVPKLSDRGSDIKRLVSDWLSSDSAGKWLMIIDNADDESMWGPRSSSTSIVDYIPRSRSGSVLVTTRSRRVAVQLAQRHVVELQQMGEKDAVEIFRSLVIGGDDDSASSDNESMSNLVLRLACLPLAIVQAAAYINVNSLSANEYLSLLETANEEEIIDLLSEDFEDETRDRWAQNSIASTWLISFKQIQTVNTRAIDYLYYISCLSEKNIPQSLLLEASNQKELVEIIGTLTGYSFITKQTQSRPSTGDVLFNTHRLVRLATRNWLRTQDLLGEWVETALRRMSKLFPRDKHDKREQWKLYMPHAEALCESRESYDLAQRYTMLEQIGVWFSADGAYKKAVTHLSTVLKWRIETQGLSNVFTLYTHINLGDALYRSGKYPESETHLNTALEEMTRLYGPGNERTIKAMNALSTLYRKQTRWAEAEVLLHQVVKFCEEKYGSEHKSTLGAKGNLAIIYWKQGFLGKAEELEKQVLKATKKAEGAEHRHTLLSMESLTAIYIKQGRLLEAERISDEAVEISRKIFGPEHQHTLHHMSFRLRIDIEQKRWDSAKALALPLYEASIRTWGASHPETLRRGDQLRLYYTETGDYAKATELATETLKLSEETLGSGHLETISRMSYLAVALEVRGKLPEARQLMKRCVELSEKRLGPLHEDTVRRKERFAEWLTVSDAESGLRDGSSAAYTSLRGEVSRTVQSSPTAEAYPTPEASSVLSASLAGSIDDSSVVHVESKSKRFGDVDSKLSDASITQ